MPDHVTLKIRMEDGAFWATVEEFPGVFEKARRGLWRFGWLRSASALAEDQWAPADH
jgi:hypothetical protein